MRQELRLVALVPQLSLNFFLTDASALTNNGRFHFHWLLSAQLTSLEAFAPDLILAPAVTNAAQVCFLFFARVDMCMFFFFSI